MESAFGLAQSGEVFSVPFSPGQTVLAACREAGLWLDAPCGGRGECGKCLIRVIQNGQERIARACRTQAQAGMRVAPLAQARPGSGAEQVFSNAGGPAGGEPPKAGADGPLLMALDIGTTTLAGRLTDASGQTLAEGSSANPQRAYGADVISRIQYAMERGSAPLTRAAAEALDALGRALCTQAGASPARVERICAAGNSCMHHLFWGLPVDSLATAPYKAYDTRLRERPALEAGLSAFPMARLITPPLIASFVGADTVAAALAAGMDARRGPALLMDVGTNGELVLTAGGRLWACSTAAGPAFEGAKIRFGMRAEAGALTAAALREGEIELTWLGDGPLRGVCGTGLIDLAALLVKAGLMDETGRILARQEAPPGPLARRLVSFEGDKAVQLTQQVYLTQRDVRELQLAKAALQAGVRLLCDQAGVPVASLREVLLAGAFGSSLSPEGAMAIGLLPQELTAEIRPIGNAALDGAAQMLVNPENIPRAEALARGTENIELASLPGFEDAFVDALTF